MSVLERYIGELQALHSKVAVDSLSNIPEGNRNAYGFGVAVGRLEGLQLAQRTLEQLLSEPEVDESGSGRSRRKA